MEQLRGDIVSLRPMLTKGCCKGNNYEQKLSLDFPDEQKNPPLKESFSDFICNFAVSIDEFSCLFCSTKTGEFSEMK